MAIVFARAFQELTGYPPFRWQERLFADFAAGVVHEACDIPTGLGKTSIIPIWLIALAAGAERVRSEGGALRLPRRLVYVVDRRTVVDQATDVTERIRRRLRDADPSSAAAPVANILRALCLDPNDKASPLAVSTLRGEHADNREWQADPARPAIIVGTVDMIGSRLLFSAYGASRKMRPFHAGLLGQDVLLVHDEAHLVPPFEALIRSIEDVQAAGGWGNSQVMKVAPAFRALSLSATGRNTNSGAERIFRLTEDDRADGPVQVRLTAEKKLSLHPDTEAKQKLAERLADCAWECATAQGPAHVLVYCHRREDAAKVKEAIDGRLKKAHLPPRSELMVGQRRVHERERLRERLIELGFLAPDPRIAAGERPPPENSPTFLVATSAGEVGVDLDADHMVCDLVPWERMVQRLGRVNRRGGKSARIEIVPGVPPDKKADEGSAPSWEILHKAVELLDGDASPGKIETLRKDPAAAEVLRQAQTPAPLRPALTRALLEAWSMTTLKTHSGRPEVQPWLRGWVDEDVQSTVIWRNHLPVTLGAETSTEDINAFFEAAPPHTSEMLEAETWRVSEWLLARAAATIDETRKTLRPVLQANSPVLIVLSAENEIEGKPYTLAELAALHDKVKKRERERFERGLPGRTLVVSAAFGGLDTDGLLNGKHRDPPQTVEEGTWPAAPFRVFENDTPQSGSDPNWKEAFRLAIDRNPDGEPIRWMIVEESHQDISAEDARAISPKPQLLMQHQERAAEFAAALAHQFGLPEEFVNTLRIAALLHDEGKRSRRWQRAFHAPPGGPWAKTRGPINQQLLDGYRHEFGSVVGISRNSELKAQLAGLSPEFQDLALHLIAAHHGFARPLQSARSCEAAPPSALRNIAQEITLRFARVQERWGPWTLAWLETLLRASDQLASRENDAAGVGTAEPANIAELVS